MGQKVSTFGFRLGPVYTWTSRWFAQKGDIYASQLLEDQKLRKYLMENLKADGI